MLNCSYLFHDKISVFQFTLLVLALLLVFIVLFFKTLYSGWLSLLGLLLFIVGGLYNLWIRVSQGCVTDPINLIITYVNWADIAITVGLFLVVIGHIMYRHSGS